jgi:hypothetical protein
MWQERVVSEIEMIPTFCTGEVHDTHDILGSVGVLTSVPVALVIKGQDTHTLSNIWRDSTTL